MIFMMSVASAMVHWKHGWDAIATGGMESTIRLNGLSVVVRELPEPL